MPLLGTPSVLSEPTRPSPTRMPLAKTRTMVFISPVPRKAGALTLVMLSVLELPGQRPLSLVDSRSGVLGAAGALGSKVSRSGSDSWVRPEAGAGLPPASRWLSKMATAAVTKFNQPRAGPAGGVMGKLVLSWAAIRLNSNRLLPVPAMGVANPTEAPLTNTCTAAPFTRLARGVGLG